MPAHLEASGPELLMVPWCTVEAAVPMEHRLDLSRDGRVLLSPWTRVVLPLPPLPLRATPSCLQSQAVEKRSDRRLISRNLSAAAAPTASGSPAGYAKCAAASLKKSFSLRSSRFSFRSLASSALSSLVSWP